MTTANADPVASQGASSQPAAPNGTKKPQRGAIGRFFGWILRGIFGASLWSFWGKRIILSRILPITLYTFATYNPWGYDYTSWAKQYLRSCPTFDFADVRFSGFVLVTLILGGFWMYLLVKAWQGVGERFYKAAIPIGAAILIMIILINLGWVPGSGFWFKFAVTGIVGVLIGLCYSLTLVDRYWSATATAYLSGDDGHHSGGDDGHHH